jgi:protease IV
MSKDARMILALLSGGFLVLILLMFTFLFYFGGGMGSSLNDNFIGDTVAIVPLQGEIAYGQSNILGGTVITPDVVNAGLEKAEEDPSVTAIVLEVNSPGGSPVASEEIMENVKNSKKPIVVWISDVGASGAYLVASAADKIVASPSSTVGSIGVILSLTDLSELYQKIGVNQSSIKAGEYKDMGADYRPLTAEERQMLQNMVNEDYDYFISLVADNRKLDKNYVRSIAEGKIYTGTQAKNLKLVDETGSRDHALELAARLGGINGSYKVITINPPQSFEDILNSLSTNVAYSLGRGIGSFMQKGAVQYNFR